MKICLLLFASLFALGNSLAVADEPTEVVARATEAATQLIGTLSDEEKSKLIFEFDNDTQRRNWSNLPEGIVQRGGLRMGDLSTEQKDAVMQLLKCVMSDEGVQQVIDNMEGDQLLVRGEGGRPAFGRDEYFVSFLGTPSTTRPWMLQFGGHHLAINATIVGDQITLSPSLTGGQPVRYELDGRKVRQLGSEEDKAFELAKSLTDEQQKVAILADRPANLLWGPGEEGATPMDQGIPAEQLSSDQQKLLLQLIQERIRILNDTHAEIEMAKAKDNLNKTWFAWFGPTESGRSASYRIQGPTLLIEYCPQGRGQGAPEHLHAMYRDPSNDYGIGLVESQKK